MPSAEIITIGTELLLGETVDTNTRFIACTLRGLGVDLYRTQTIGDNAGRIAEAILQALERADIVITTGGLGPTVDDPTRQAVAEALGTELVFHPELWAQIANRIGRYGRTPTENQKRQAYLPKGAIAIKNPVGTAPAFIVELPSPLPTPPALLRGASPSETMSRGEEKKVIVTLPGVPREMETLLTNAIIPYLQECFHLHAVIQVRTLHVSGIGEGALDEQVGDLEILSNPTIGLAAHSGVVDIRIAAKAETEAEAGRMIAEVEKDLRTRLGNNLFGADGDTLESVALEALAQRGWSLACLESGLEGALLTRLARTAHLAYRGGNSREVQKETLSQIADSTRQEFHASVVLGVALFISDEQREALITIATPRGQKQRLLTYGGPPQSAPRWAANNALDWLRRITQEKE